MITNANIKRRILLIGGYGDRDQQGFRNGIRHDIDSMKRHFLSAYGGAFRESVDLKAMIRPSLEWVRRQLAWLDGADYAVIYVSSHGNSQNGRAFVYLSDHESIAVDELLGRAHRQITICDSCRNEVSTYHNFIGGEPEGLGELPFGDLDFARWAFNKLVMARPRVQVLIQSSEYNQSSGGPATGGIFTNALLKEIYSFAREERHGGILAAVAFNKASVRVVSQTKNNQVPTIRTWGDGSTSSAIIAIQPKVIFQHLQKSQPHPAVQPKPHNGWKWLLGGLALVAAVAVVASSSSDNSRR